jgi:HicA toxin of bacterial toxin-antitoxin,
VDKPGNQSGASPSVSRVKPTRLLARIRRGDVSNVPFTDLVNLVEALGFQEVGGRGSHRVFAHPAILELINLQEDRGQAKRYQVRQVAGLIQRYALDVEEEP